MQVELGEFTIIIDLEDVNLLHSFNWGCVVNTGQLPKVVASINGKLCQFHRIKLNIYDDRVIFFKNGNPLDFRKSNLQIKNRGKIQWKSGK